MHSHKGLSGYKMLRYLLDDSAKTPIDVIREKIGSQ